MRLLLAARCVHNQLAQLQSARATAKRAATTYVYARHAPAADASLETAHLPAGSKDMGNGWIWDASIQRFMKKERTMKKEERVAKWVQTATGAWERGIGPGTGRQGPLQRGVGWASRRQWQKRLRAGKGGAGASGQQQRQQQRRLGGGGKRGWVT